MTGVNLCATHFESTSHIQADLTKESSKQVKALRIKYRVIGVPTVIILDSKGQEYRRFTDELLDVEPQEFVEIMEGVL